MSEYYFVVRYLKIAFGGIKVTFGCVFLRGALFLGVSVMRRG